MSKKKNSPYSMIMQESIGYGTAGILSGQLSMLSGDPTAMNVFKIGSSMAGIPSLLCVSKKVMGSFKGW
jgi:hypothetical protein